MSDSSDESSQDYFSASEGEIVTDSEMESEPEFTDDSGDESSTTETGDSENAFSVRAESDNDGSSTETESIYVSFRPSVSQEQKDLIAAIPTAEATKRNANSLASLCIAKIISAAMRHHQEGTHDCDLNSNTLPFLEHVNQQITMFANPTFRMDLENIYRASCVIDSEVTELWFPNVFPTINLLRKFGHIFAFEAIKQPEAHLLAVNYLLAARPVPHNMLLGYLVTIHNLPNIMHSMCYAIANRTDMIKDEFQSIGRSKVTANIALQNHTRAFLAKYFPE
jgi:hypothetical protein